MLGICEGVALPRVLAGKLCQTGSPREDVYRFDGVRESQLYSHPDLLPAGRGLHLFDPPAGSGTVVVQY